MTKWDFGVGQMVRMTVEFAKLLAEKYFREEISFSEFVVAFANEESQREVRRTEADLKRLSPLQRREALIGF